MVSNNSLPHVSTDSQHRLDLTRFKHPQGPYQHSGSRPAILSGVDTEQIIAEIERLERIFAAPDTRPPNASDLAAANRKHDDKLAYNPWFRLWQRYGVCCRPEPPIVSLGKIES